MTQLQARARKDSEDPCPSRPKGRAFIPNTLHGEKPGPAARTPMTEPHFKATGTMAERIRKTQRPRWLILNFSSRGALFILCDSLFLPPTVTECSVAYVMIFN